ncbi:MAG: DUF1624 domain-containing protein [Gammaproteobacteria bacterium]|nr:DUF1624 domain-containing protein [Gammaproteobacteria bacterium]MDH5652450.1 DUF1624 domain-containing protein [Gammaproteobacteria bacterium]
MSSSATQRLLPVDLLRGGAIVLMFIYHFCFDLNYFGYVAFRFNTDPAWINFRILIVSLFLFTVGISLQLAHGRQWRPDAFYRRLALVAGAALLVSLSSYTMYPKTMIWFGILHFIALAGLLGLLLLRFYYLNLLLGVLVILAFHNLEHPFFDQPALQWVGLMTRRPQTEDYVPLIPWLAPMLFGLFAGRWIINQTTLPGWLTFRSTHPVLTTLAFGGRHSLLIYLLHQPIFLGMLYLVSRVIKP